MEENFSELGRVAAIAKLFEGSGYKPFEDASFEAGAKEQVVNASRVLLEGIDFDLTYFPLKHLGYKSVIAATGELYASLARPKTLAVTLGISAKLDYVHISELFGGIVTAAKEHGYKKIALDLMPSRNGLTVVVSANGATSKLTATRRPQAKSMDLICVSGELGAAYMGMQVLVHEKQNFNKDTSNQPKLDDHKMLVGAYLKPEIDAHTVDLLEKEEIYPSHGYFITKGFADAVKRLVRDSGLGAKVYVDKIPFESGTFDLGKRFNIDPISAAFNGGDDCKLLFTVPIGSHDKFRHDFQTFDIIGHLAKPDVGAVIVTPDGVELPMHSQGWK
jgi:thiamine-monophosphate kinase